MLEKSNQLFSYSNLLTTIPLKKYTNSYPLLVTSFAPNLKHDKLPFTKLKADNRYNLYKKSTEFIQKTNTLADILTTKSIPEKILELGKIVEDSSENNKTLYPLADATSTSTTYTFSVPSNKSISTALGSSTELLNSLLTLQTDDSKILKNSENILILGDAPQ